MYSTWFQGEHHSPSNSGELANLHSGGNGILAFILCHRSPQKISKFLSNVIFSFRQKRLRGRSLPIHTNIPVCLYIWVPLTEPTSQLVLNFIQTIHKKLKCIVKFSVPPTETTLDGALSFSAWRIFL